MSIQIIILLLADILCTVAGHLLLKKGMMVLGPLDFSIANLGTLFLAGIKNIYLWFGLIGYGGAFVLWLFILSQVKLSVAYPITALVYVLVIFSSWFFFKESIGTYQLVGSAIIICGLIVLFKAV